MRKLSEFDAWFRLFQEIRPREARTVFLSVFIGWTDLEESKELIRRLTYALPDVTIVGCSTAGEIMSGRMSEQTAILNFMFFEKTEVHVYAFDFSETPPEDAAASLTVKLRGGSVAGVGLLVADNDENGHRFLASLRPMAPDAKVFGIIAGIPEGSVPCIWIQDRSVRHGAIAFCFLGSELRVDVNNIIGWSSLGPAFQITKMDGDVVLKELDGRPASYVYKKYLALSPGDFGEEEGLLFPLCLERNGQQVMRLPAACLEDGSLVISGDCREGEFVRLAYGDPSVIFSAAHRIHLNIAAFQPEAILLFSCVSRRLFLQEDTNHELQPFQVLAPNAGCYGHGEICRDNDGSVPILNMTLVAVSFREGAQGDSRSSADSSKSLLSTPKTKKLTGTMKLVQCLANFVAVTSAESELANEKLAHLASIDRLTGLYNRGETEAILERELLKNQASGATLSAIMIDLDNFKQVNDTFGHATGDDVLRWAAHVILRQVRLSDAGGRWGGEEFFLVLPGASVKAAVEIAEKIRAAMEADHPLPDGGTVTASIGVAKFPKGGDTMSFYKALDEALYRAKTGGKNKVCVAGA